MVRHRLWCKDTSEYLEGDEFLIDGNGDIFLIEVVDISVPLDGKVSLSIAGGSTQLKHIGSVDDDNYKLERYTNMDDIENNMIFDGDLVDIPSFTDPQEVFFTGNAFELRNPGEKGGYSIITDYLFDREGDVIAKVVGNINQAM